MLLLPPPPARARAARAPAAVAPPRPPAILANRSLPPPFARRTRSGRARAGARARCCRARLPAPPPGGPPAARHPGPPRLRLRPPAVGRPPSAACKPAGAGGGRESEGSTHSPRARAVACRRAHRRASSRAPRAPPLPFVLTFLRFALPLRLLVSFSHEPSMPVPRGARGSRRSTHWQLMHRVATPRPSRPFGLGGNVRILVHSAPGLCVAGKERRGCNLRDTKGE